MEEEERCFQNKIIFINTSKKKTKKALVGMKVVKKIEITTVEKIIDMTEGVGEEYI